jgi:hypothetical protein
MSAINRTPVTPEEAVIILRTPPKSISRTLLVDWFASTKSKPVPRFESTRELIIPKEFRVAPPGNREEGDWDPRWSPNWSSIDTTTVGRYVANSLIFSRSLELRSITPYTNEPWRAKVIEKLQQNAMDNFLLKKVTAEDMAWMIDRIQWLGYGSCRFMASSFSINTFRLPKEVAAYKKSILEGPRGQTIKTGDLEQVYALEDELMAKSTAILKDTDTGFETFDSGSGRNNYKSISVMRGAVRKSDEPDVLRVSTASLNEGIPADEIPIYADILVAAIYGRAMGTAKGGYIAKQINAAMQTLKLDPDPKSDCHTDLTANIKIDNPSEYIFRYYVSGGRLIEITKENMNSLTDKVVKMRSPLYCGGKDGICSICAGSLYHRIGITNIGLIANRIGTRLLNNSLKAFHDPKVKTRLINFNDYIKERKT